MFRIFDQTFAVTRLLQAMSLLIAVCGVTLTLVVLARERVSELALYRSLGATRPQIFRVFLGKGLGMALFGLVLGAPGGAALAMILTSHAAAQVWRELGPAPLTRSRIDPEAGAKVSTFTCPGPCTV